ncbi:MAG: recombinase family protein [Clostridia bacterium]|nr:recombinase family protein [Clostridia bacterium]
MQWYDELRKQYPNWVVVDRYIDDSLTGMQAKKRPEFMRMLNDAKSGKFDLIVTREVSRFARNTVECLEFTRQLKSLNVEVYFVHESIWTLDNSGEMILTIMAMVAQEESRKMSERVKAGQAMSRKNGVLYGNGNILGYDRVGDTYVINQEQAETVRLIYNLYESGMGMQAIRNELIRLGKKNARGTTEGDVTRISKCLRNTVYKGVMVYNKSHSNNFLDQKTIITRDEDSYIYVAGKFEPIISSEQWEWCKHIRESHKKVQAIDVNGEIAIRKIASHKNNNVWTNKLRCRCGSSMRKKWHTRHNGVNNIWLKCYSQLNNGADKIVDPNDQGFCNVRAICDWKLEMMALYVSRHLFKHEKTLSLAAKTLTSESFLEKQEREKIRKNYEEKIKGLAKKNTAFN